VTLPVFLRFVPPGIPRIADVTFSGPVWWFMLAATVFTALACGVGPAVRASRPDFTRLREGGRGSTGRRHWARNVLVAGQTALALVLLIGSGLLLRSFWELSRVDPGYSTKDLFTFQIAPDRPELRDGPAFARFDLAFMDRLRALPGVETVGLVENIPLNEGTAGLRVMPEGRAGATDTGALLRYTFTAGDYFEAMDIAVLGGRAFDNDDHLLPRQSAIVSRSAAALLWPGENAVGKRFRRQGLEEWFTVVGVVEDVMQNNFREAAQPLIYYPLVGPKPLNWVISSPAFVVKSPRAETIAADVRALVRQVAPEAPMYRVFTMAGLARDSMVDVSFTMLTLGVASGLALLLGSVGLYAVLSYIVAERTREIGVRMALGAQIGQVRRLVVVQGSRVVFAGVAIGLGVALASTRALGSLLYGVEAVDAATFAAMSISMIVIGLVACYLPARRASNVDPVQSLRGD
jgi:putative ABC transport system permease protein